MTQPVLTKYKQGDLPQDYPKKVDRMKTIDLNAEADPNVSTEDFPSKQENQVQPSLFSMANEKDY
tara:strand:+ start:323 stop:517 length:195 start_codon:yes stop_codon:yes gene_type:complete